MDIELRQSHRPGSASVASPFSMHNTQPPLPSSNSESRLEDNLARDIAEAYTLKLTEKNTFETARHLGRAEMPSSLAIRAGLVLFTNESGKEYIKNTKFLKNPSEYESSIGKVYCDAGSGIYAHIVKERQEAIFKYNHKVQHLCTDRAKGDLIEVVLYQYRNSTKAQSSQAMAYLERLIEEALLAVHGADASGSANASEGNDGTVFAWMHRWWRDGFMMRRCCAWMRRWCAWMCSHHLSSNY